MEKIILASGSPRRRELLTTAGVEFEVSVSFVDESVPDGTLPEQAALTVARRKAQAVAEKNPGRVILAADTSVVYGSEIMGKPRSADDAFRMLKLLSGKTHRVLTGVCIIKDETMVSFVETTEVKFYELTDEEIRAYIATGEPTDKAGAYGIQGRGCTLVEGINGDYFNVVGLPVARVCRELKELK